MTRTARVTLRTAEPSDAVAIHAIIAAHLVEGHLLPRELGEIEIHASRFMIAMRGRAVVGCAELAPLSAQVAEVRSLAVDASARRRGIGALLVEELQRRARREGFETVRLHARARLLHADGFLHRAAPLDFRESIH